MGSEKVRLFIVSIPALVSCAILTGLFVDLSFGFAESFKGDSLNTITNIIFLFGLVPSFISSWVGLFLVFKTADCRSESGEAF
jgi:hypothetical protein